MTDVDEDGGGGIFRDFGGAVGIDKLGAAWQAVPRRWKAAQWWQHCRMWASGVMPWCPYCGCIVAGKQGQKAHEKNVHSEEGYQHATAPGHYPDETPGYQ